MSSFQQHSTNTHSPYIGPSQAAIVWPLRYQPGTTDSFISNEIIAKDVNATQVWAVLSDFNAHASCSNHFVASARSEPKSMLEKGYLFSMKTQLDTVEATTCVVKECVAPERLAWCSDFPTKDGEFYHAWLIEDLMGGRVRILSQQSIIDGSPHEDDRVERRNRRLIGHQDWLEGLVAAARSSKPKGSGGFITARRTYSDN